MLDELEWPSLEARRDRLSLLLFHKIHSGTMSIEKRRVPDPYSQFENYKVITQYPVLKIPHIQGCLEELLFPQTSPQWNSLSPSVVNSQTT